MYICSYIYSTVFYHVNKPSAIISITRNLFIYNNFFNGHSKLFLYRNFTIQFYEHEFFWIFYFKDFKQIYKFWLWSGHAKTASWSWGRINIMSLKYHIDKIRDLFNSFLKHNNRKYKPLLIVQFPFQFLALIVWMGMRFETCYSQGTYE